MVRLNGMEVKRHLPLRHTPDDTSFPTFISKGYKKFYDFRTKMKAGYYIRINKGI